MLSLSRKKTAPRAWGVYLRWVCTSPPQQSPATGFAASGGWRLVPQQQGHGEDRPRERQAVALRAIGGERAVVGVESARCQRFSPSSAVLSPPQLERAPA